MSERVFRSELFHRGRPKASKTGSHAQIVEYGKENGVTVKILGMKMRLAVEIYERGDDWFFQPMSRATTGLWVATPPIICLKKQDSLVTKATAILDSLSQSSFDVPVPEASENLLAPLLEKSSIKSWNVFMKHAKCVGVDLEGGRLSMIPSRKLRRPAAALEGIPEQAIALSADAPLIEVGSALEEKLWA